MSPNTLFFTGAPLSSSLDWRSDELLDAFSSSIARFAGLDKDGEPGPQLAPSQAYASWRSLRVGSQHLPTGHSQIHASDEYQGNAAFFAESDPSFSFDGTPDDRSFPRSEGSHSGCQSIEAVASQFYEHSFALHEGLPSSQIPIPAPNDNIIFSGSEDGNTTYSTTSFETSASDPTADSQSIVAAVARVSIPVTIQISNLESIPNVAYLQSIHPQTMTVNLIVGIISISLPRLIQTRRGVCVEIVEMLVGDETKSGFGINFWIPSSPAKTKKEGANSVKDALTGLRPQDIILLRNLALSSFRGKVYGQSLRRDMTKVDLLYRNRIDRTDVGGCYTAKDLKDIVEGVNRSPLAKAGRVRDWVIRFVGLGVGTVRRTEKGKVEIMKEMMPPDTQ